jgi:hypothetical protein
MGIRFACHECGKRLNIKSELAGRRGVCPACAAKFRIPLIDAETSRPVEEKPPDSPTYGAPAPPENLTSDQSASLHQHEPEASWYVRPPSGGQYGPAPTGLLEQWISEGRVAASSLIWRDGWPQWRTATEAFPELAARLPGGQPFAGAEALNESKSPQETDANPLAKPIAAGVAGGAVGTVLERPQASAGKSPPPSKAPIEPTGAATGTFTTEPILAGQSTIGAQRRVRSMRRVLWIGLLSAFAIMLVGVLLVVANRG